MEITITFTRTGKIAARFLALLFAAGDVSGWTHLPNENREGQEKNVSERDTLKREEIGSAGIKHAGDIAYLTDVFSCNPIYSTFILCWRATLVHLITRGIQ